MGSAYLHPCGKHDGPARSPWRTPIIFSQAYRWRSTEAVVEGDVVILSEAKDLGAGDQARTAQTGNIRPVPNGILDLSRMAFPNGIHVPSGFPPSRE